MTETSARQIITHPNALRTTLLSPGVLHTPSQVIFVSGSVGADYTAASPVTAGKTKPLIPVSDSVGDQTRKTLENIEAILKAGGSSLDKLLKVNIYLTDIEDFGAMNKVYEKVIPEPRPARTCVIVKDLPFTGLSHLVKGFEFSGAIMREFADKLFDVEIECTAYV